ERSSEQESKPVERSARRDNAVRVSVSAREIPVGRNERPGLQCTERLLQGRDGKYDSKARRVKEAYDDNGTARLAATRRSTNASRPASTRATVSLRGRARIRNHNKNSKLLTRQSSFRGFLDIALDSTG